MFIGPCLISLVLTVSALATSNQGPVVRLDDAVGHLSLRVPFGGYSYVLDLEGFHRFSQRERDKVLGHPFRETAVRITRIDPFSIVTS